jgi:hypothetical protein
MPAHFRRGPKGLKLPATTREQVVALKPEATKLAADILGGGNIQNPGRLFDVVSAIGAYLSTPAERCILGELNFLLARNDFGVDFQALCLGLLEQGSIKVNDVLADPRFT